MSQNRSSAVMQQRSEPHNSLDDFPTPPWATRALCEWLDQHVEGGLLKLTCREPAANRGHMVEPLSEYFGQIFASDIHDYGAGYPVFDYLFDGDDQYDFTITNPPFRLAQRFIEKALKTSRVGVAVIVRTAFLEGKQRYAELFSRNAPSVVLQFVERCPMVKGRIDKNAGSATAYCWLVWLVWLDGEYPTRFDWIQPCRKRLERESDYPKEEKAPATGVI